MDTLQCAVVLAKLALFDWELQQRQRAAATYDALLLGNEAGVRPVGRRDDRTSVYAQYTVVLDRRADLQAALQANRIPTAVHYPVPIHRQPAYAHLDPRAACPVSDALAGRVMSLPMGPYLSDAEIRTVCATLLRAAQEAATPAPAAACAAMNV
jgi:UDP-2-acetamido-2-deoxy-ribo-hexuluronate aminotransferase